MVIQIGHVFFIAFDKLLMRSEWILISFSVKSKKFNHISLQIINSMVLYQLPHKTECH